MSALMHPRATFRFCPSCGGKSFHPDTQKSKKCGVCGFIFYFNASAAVVAIIANPQGDVLLTVRGRNPAKGMLDLPGGFVDPGESVEDALRREISEEVNLRICSHAYCGSFPNEYLYAGVLYHTIDLMFTCQVDSFDAIRAADDVSGYLFSKISETIIAQVGLPSIQTILREYMKGNIKSGGVPFSEGA